MRAWKTGASLILAGMVMASCADSSDEEIHIKLDSVVPNSGAAGITVTLNGAQFPEVMQVCFASSCTQAQVKSSGVATVIVPQGTGRVDVQITGDGQSSVLKNGFEYTPGGGGSSDGSGEVDTTTPKGDNDGWNTNVPVIPETPSIQSMGPTAGKAGTSVTITGANLDGVSQVCFATNCVQASATDGKITVSAPEGSGTVAVTVIVAGNRLTAGQFTYLTESADSNEIDWCRLTYMPGSTHPGEAVTAYAEVYKSQCTPGCDKIKGQIGYISASSPKAGDKLSYTWADAARNTQFDGPNSGSNDEYFANLTFNSEGRYKVAYRFTLDDHNWTYCDTVGTTEGFSTDRAAELTVAAEPPAEIEWCLIVNGNTSISNETGADSEYLYAQFFVPGCTSATGDHCADLKVEAGYGSRAISSEDGIADGYTWQEAEINAGYDGIGGQDHDEYMARFNTNDAGTYAVAYRASLDGGRSWTYCDTSNDGSFNVRDAATWTVSEPGAEPQPAEPTIEWCNIQYPAATAVRSGNTSELIFGQVYVAGCTDQPQICDSIKAQLGYGSESSAVAEYLYRDADFNTKAGNNDEYMSTFSPMTEGSYRYAYRFSLDNGQSWKYCDLAGNIEGEEFRPESAGVMTVTADKDEIGWCQIVGPRPLPSVKAGTETEMIYAQVYAEGCTGKGTEPCSSVKAQVGYGSKTAADASGFTYVDAAYNDKAVAHNNDEFMAVLSPTAAGQYGVAYRFSTDNGRTWTYCDTEDSVGFKMSELLDLTVESDAAEPDPGTNPEPGPAPATPTKYEGHYTCGFDGSNNKTASASDEVDIYGQIWIEGCTQGKICGDVRAAYLLYDAANGSADISTWTKVTASINDGYTPNENNEYMTKQTYAAGTYRFAYAFELLKEGTEGTPETVYCYLDWADAPAYGTLTINQ